jgi:hypothetical protein
MTQQGFLRLATNPNVAGKHALTLTDAWQKYDTYLTIRESVSPANPSVLSRIGEPLLKAVLSRRRSGTTRIWLHSP